VTGLRMPLAAAAALAMILMIHTAMPARAADVMISGRTGDVISEIANATRQIKFASVPSDLRVQSNTMVFDYLRGELAYTGNVQVEQGEVELSSDALVIAFEPRRSGTLRSVRASGNVTVVHEDKTATGRQAVYDPEAATITLTGDARLGAGPSSLEGARVVVYLQEGRAVVEGADASPISTAGTDDDGGPTPQKRPPGRVRAVIDTESLDVEDVLD
jgi:lipopolysaccharide transport protein LptA